MPHRLKKLILLLGDLAFLHLALFLTLVIRYPRTLWLESWQSHWLSFAVIFIIWLLVFYINNLYDLNLRVISRKFFRRIMNATIISGLLSILYFYFNIQTGITPKTNLAIFIAIFSLLFLFWRGLHQIITRSFIPRDNLAIIGSGSSAEEIMRLLKENPGAGYQTALVFKNPEELIDLSKSIEAKNIRAIVVCDDFGQSTALREALFACLIHKITFFNYPDFYELLTGKIPVEAIGQNWFLENLRAGQKNYFHLFKKIFDYLVALAILIISLLFWPLIALAIKLSSRGPIFFKQIRLGRNGREFFMIKFRTMRTENNNSAPTAENDERITAVGSFLRQTRLDEIPQLINILKGEMSFIGPRPERPEIAVELEKTIPFYKTRLLIKPGVTGWDQISGAYHSASISDSQEKLQYDLFYLKNRSLYLDLTIALKTLATMLSRSGR
jgi:exopolysaccharide biosynthesis polyprenyl glycosylphosphotransferase